MERAIKIDPKIMVHGPLQIGTFIQDKLRANKTVAYFERRCL